MGAIASIEKTAFRHSDHDSNYRRIPFGSKSNCCNSPQIVRGQPFHVFRAESHNLRRDIVGQTRRCILRRRCQVNDSPHERRFGFSDTRLLRTNRCCRGLPRFQQDCVVPSSSIFESHHQRRRLRTRHLRNVHFPSSRQHDAFGPRTLVELPSALRCSCRKH